MSYQIKVDAVICTKSGGGFKRGVVYPVVQHNNGIYIGRDLEEDETLNLHATSEGPYDESTIWYPADSDIAGGEPLFADVDLSALYQHDLKECLSQIELLAEVGETSANDLIRAGNVSSMFGAIRSIAQKGISSKRAEVLPEKVVKPDDALDEGSRGGVVHDVGNSEVDAGRKLGRCVLGLLSCCCKYFHNKLAVAKAIRVEEGVVVGDCVGESCCVEKGGVSLFGFHADYFTKFETPGWYPKTRLDYAMTSVFAKAMLGSEMGKSWLDRQRMYQWAAIRTDEQNAA